MGVTMKKIKLFSLLSIFAVIVVVLSVLVLITCSNEQILNDNNGTTQLQVRIHDEPFKSSDKLVTELNITVIKVDIVRAGTGEVINCPIKEEKEMNILEISKSNPVVLSDVSVPSGDYEQLRLVIKNNATIVVDDVSYDIKIPSGEQSGVKLDGNFSIRGKFIRLDLDFIPEESVIYNKGQGYILKPVIKILDIEDRDILGYFRGNLSLNGSSSSEEIVVELDKSNNARIKSSNYSNYTINARYQYNSISKKLRFDDIKVDIPDLPPYLPDFMIKDLLKDVPSYIEMGVKQWTPDEIIVLDLGVSENKLYKVSEFSFSDNVSFTELIVNIDYPNNNWNNKILITEIEYIGNNSLYDYNISAITGEYNKVKIDIPDSKIQGSNVDIKIDSYLAPSNSKEFFNPVKSDFNNELKTGVVLNNLNYYESTENIWRRQNIFNIKRGIKNEVNIKFPKKLNIRYDHNNFKSNKLRIDWDEYPGAQGYFVMVFVEDKIDESDIEYDDDGNKDWDIAFSCFTNDTSIEVESQKLIFYISDVPTEYDYMKVQLGDIIRIEIYPHDGSGSLSTANRKGAMFMDSAVIIR